MTGTARFSLGFLIGCVMSYLALAMSGAGHGTYFPMLLNSSVLIFLPGVGIVLALVAAPLLWGAYYGVIPAMQPRAARVVLTSVVLLLHIVPVICLASMSGNFWKQFESMDPFMMVYLVVVAAAVSVLIALSKPFDQSHDDLVE